jgi:hypothetical protein
VTIAAKTCLVLSLAGCGSYSPTGTTEPPARVPDPTQTPTPAPTPAASQYAGSWKFTIWLTAIDKQCGHTDADINVHVGPFSVTVGPNGSFVVPGPVNASGVIDSAGDIRVTFSESATCPAGSGAGGCVNLNHCDGTSVQGGDVSKWTLVRS